MISLLPISPNLTRLVIRFNPHHADQRLFDSPATRKNDGEGSRAYADHQRIVQLISDRPTVHGPWVFNPADLLSNAASQRNRRLANNVDYCLANLHTTDTTDALIIHSVKKSILRFISGLRGIQKALPRERLSFSCRPLP